MPRVQEISYLITPEDKNGERVSDETYAFLSGSQVNGGCPGNDCMRQFWRVPKRKYIVTFKLNPDGKYKIGAVDDGDYQKNYREIYRADDNCVSSFFICLFPRSWRKGTRFDRIVKLA